MSLHQPPLCIFVAQCQNLDRPGRVALTDREVKEALEGGTLTEVGKDFVAGLYDALLRRTMYRN